MFHIRTISILTILFHLHVFHLSGTVLLNHIIIVWNSCCHAIISAPVLKFVHIAIHLHPSHPYSSSLPSEFLSFLQYSSSLVEFPVIYLGFLPPVVGFLVISWLC